MAEPQEIIGTGTVAAILTILLTAIAKFLGDKRKQSNDHEIVKNKQTYEHEDTAFKRMQDRIDELEDAQKECLKRDAEQSRLIGKLETRVEILENINAELKAELNLLKGHRT